MSKNEFLEKLRAALANDLDPAAVQAQVNYYSQYIDGEIGAGRPEADVTAELGDPWAIARTIIDASGSQDYAGETTSRSSRQNGRRGAGRENQESYGQVRSSGFHITWRVVLAILGIIGIVMLVIAVVGGIISVLAPILVPLVVISVVIRAIKERR